MKVNRNINAMQFDILELIPDWLYIRIKKEFRKKIFLDAKNRFGSYRKLAKNLNFNIASVSAWKNGKQYIPLNVVNYLLKINGMKKEELRKQIFAIGIKNNIKPLIRPKLTITFDKNLARLIGYIYGDGSIGKNLRISYTNQNKFLIEKFQYLVHEIFGKNVGIYRFYNKKDKTSNLTLPKIIGLILTKINKNFSKKIIPMNLLVTNKNLIKEFLGAIFDDEGTVQFKSRGLSIVLSKRKMLQDIQNLFQILEIKTTKIKKEIKLNRKYWRLTIYRRKNFEIFNDEIMLYHPQKFFALKKLVNHYKKYKFAKHELSEKIIFHLQKNDKLTSTELTKLTGARNTTICKTLKKLEKSKMVKNHKILAINKNGQNYHIKTWWINDNSSN
jgi:hypothetical protein